MGKARNPNGRSSIIRRDDGWHGFVSFGADPKGRRLRRHVRGQTKAAVAKKVAELERLRDAGYLGGSPQTVGEWLDAFLDERARARIVRPTTLAGYELDIRCHLKPFLGTKRLDRLGPTDIAQLWVALSEGHRGPATIQHVRRTLSAALSTAVNRGLLARNPIPLAPPPPYRAPEPRVLTLDEVRSVLAVAAASSPGELARWSLAFLGMRQGEALGLTWGDFDDGAAVLTIRRQLRWSGGEPTLAPLKTQTSERVLPLPPPVVEALRAHRRAHVAARLRAGGRWADFAKSDGGLIFPDGNSGYPRRRRADWEAWHRLLRQAGVAPVRLHDARHVAATLLAATGAPSVEVAAILGHGRGSSTTARYLHASESGAVRAVAAFAQTLFARPSEPAE